MSEFTYFLHIPKTAGTSFTFFLKKFFNQDEIYPLKAKYELDKNKEIRETFNVDFANYHLIHGHFTYAIVKYLPPETNVITMLRDPVERCLSHYHHVLHDTTRIHYHKGQIIRNMFDGDWNKLLDIEDLASGKKNLQVKHLGLEENLLSDNPLKVRDLFDFEGILGDLTSEELRLITDNAIKNLEKISFFGLQEFFEQSQLLFYLHFDKRFNKVARDRFMVFPNRPKKDLLGDEVIQKLQSMNEADMKLYEKGVVLFKERYLAAFNTLAKSMLHPPIEFEDINGAIYLLTKKEKLRETPMLVRNTYNLGGLVARTFRSAIKK